MSHQSPSVGIADLKNAMKIYQLFFACMVAVLCPLFATRAPLEAIDEAHMSTRHTLQFFVRASSLPSLPKFGVVCSVTGTPAVEFVATWVARQNARQITQALTACRDGHAVTIATHTWEVGLPEKRSFFNLKFDAQKNI